MRRAFALAFDLAIHRDPVHSLIVPLLVRAPWSIALALLPSTDQGDAPADVLMQSSILLCVDYLMLLTVTAMLRIRAQSVFHSLPDLRLPPVLECYGRAIRRVPWLFVTEVVRNMAILFATFFLVLPAIFLGFRLSFATEAVVLHEPNLAESFSRSFRLTHGRFERWLEMIAVSVVLVLGIAFTGALLSLVFPKPGYTTWAAITWLAITAITPVVQYAWTFFYLRLVEVDAPGQEVGPAYAAAPSTPPAATPAPSAHERAGEGAGSAELQPRLG